MFYSAWVMFYSSWVMFYSSWVMFYSSWAMFYSAWVMFYSAWIMFYRVRAAAAAGAVPDAALPELPGGSAARRVPRSAQSTYSGAAGLRASAGDRGGSGDGCAPLGPSPAGREETGPQGAAGAAAPASAGPGVLHRRAGGGWAGAGLCGAPTAAAGGTHVPRFRTGGAVGAHQTPPVSLHHLIHISTSPAGTVN